MLVVLGYQAAQENRFAMKTTLPFIIKGNWVHHKRGYNVAVQWTSFRPSDGRPPHLNTMLWRAKEDIREQLKTLSP